MHFGAASRVRSSRRCVTALGALWCSGAAAHGFGQRYDLPVPLFLYLSGAAAAVVLSFVVMAAFVRLTPGNALMRAFDAGARRLSIHPLVVIGGRLAAVIVLIAVVIAGFFGNPAPVKNIAPIMVWAIWWVGMAYVCALIGDVWTLVNPLDALFGWMEKLYARLTLGARLARNLDYPASLGAWPAAILFFGFAWAELAWDSSDVPRYVATAVVFYCALTWLAMFTFGRERWLEHGEAFAFIFSLLGRFAPIHVVRCDDRFELVPRPYAVGLLDDKPVSSSLMILVIMMLATVTFDGLMETPLWAELADQLSPHFAGLAPGRQSAAVTTAGLAGTVCVFLAVYVLCARLIADFAVSGSSVKPPAAGVIARYFVLTLVPISVGYHLAHYLTFIVMAGQYLIPLLSDPLGTGVDLFGTANYIVRIGIVDARFVWYASVSAIVIGHIAAVYLAHMTALRVFGDKRAALRSQSPMLALMVAYTMVSLWIIAQPIVNSRFG